MSGPENQLAIQEDPGNGHLTPVMEAQVTNPLDLDPDIFQSGLDRRKTNRDALMKWVSDSLVENVDFGRIHVVPKKKCDKGKNCTNKAHFARPSLFKPGAEKICGMLGLTPTFPNLQEYEQIVLNGQEVRQIIIRCEMVSPSGQVIAEGVGARSITQDSGDLNKALKMTLKSSQIDATLRCAGLSEVFTQDVEDMNWNEEDDKPTEFSRDYVLTFGKHKGEKIRDIESSYLIWLMNNAKDNYLREYAQKEMEARDMDLAKETESQMTGTPSKNGKIDAEQKAHIQQVIESHKFTDEERKKTSKWLKSNPSESDAAKKIIALNGELDKRGGRWELEISDLIELAMTEWKYEQPRAVELLNERAQERYNVKLIDNLTPVQIMQLHRLIVTNEVVPF